MSDDQESTIASQLGEPAFNSRRSKPMDMTPGREFRNLPYPVQQAIWNSQSATLGAGGSGISGHLIRMNEKVRDGGELSRGDVRKILRLADGYQVEAHEETNGTFSFLFHDGRGEQLSRGGYRLRPNAKNYLADKGVLVSSAETQQSTSTPAPETAATRTAAPVTATGAESATIDPREYAFVPPLTMTMDRETIKQLGVFISATLNNQNAAGVAAIEQFLQASGMKIEANTKLSETEAAAAINRLYGMAGSEVSQPAAELLHALPPAPKQDRQR